jgi:hypothetical protein
LNTDEIKEVAGSLKEIAINLKSEDAREVAKKYLVLDFIKSQVSNVIWCPLALAIAFVVYAAGRWLLAH